MKDLESKTRRGFLRQLSTLVALPLEIDLASSVVEAAPFQLAYAPPKISCGIGLSAVRSGRSTPEAYLDDKTRCVPEIVSEMASGRLKGLIFAPSDAEIERIARTQLSPHVNSPRALNSLVTSVINEYSSYLKQPDPVLGTHPLANVFPLQIGLIGGGLAAYIIILPEFFRSKYLIADGDGISILRHELKHVKDLFQGIQLGNDKISINEVSNGNISPKFLRYIVELRGYYTELYNWFESKVKLKQVPTSTDFLGQVVGAYSRMREYVQNEPKTPFERRIGQTQLKETSGVSTKRNGNVISLNCDLFRVKEAFTFKYASQ